MLNLLLFFAPIILTWDHPGGLELQGFKIYSGPTMTSLEHVETLEKDAREYSFEHPGDETKCFAISSRNLSGESERATKVGDDDLCLGKPFAASGIVPIGPVKRLGELEADIYHPNGQKWHEHHAACELNNYQLWLALGECRAN